MSGSARIKDQNMRRVLDDAARQRRARKALQSLEQDNSHEDPHADLVMSKKALSLFQEDSPEKRPKRKARTTEYYKQRFRKTIDQLLDEDAGADEEGEETVGYLAAQVPESRRPSRFLCAVCGFPSSYTCVTCGTKYCSLRCLETHQDTRCLKWTS